MVTNRARLASQKIKEFCGVTGKIVCISAALLGSYQAHAAIECVGKVGKVLLYADGSVNVLGAWRGDYTIVCNTNGGAVSTEVCLSWYATLLKAKANNTDVTVYYNTTYACNNLPTYGSTPTPVYVGAW